MSTQEVSNVEVMSEYFKLGQKFGDHSFLFSLERFEGEYKAYVLRGRHIPSGNGEHRGTPRNSAYNVVEDGTRDALKAAMLGKRSDYALRA